MNRALESFLKALRHAEIRVSPAESIDAVKVVDRVGYGNRTLLKDSLAVTLAKTPDEKERFDEAFDLFFTSDRMPDAGRDGTTDDNAPTGPLDPDSVADPLARAILDGDESALQVAVEAAARKLDLTEMWVFTQKPLFVRKILDEVGLDGLDDEIAAQGPMPLGLNMQRVLSSGRARLFQYAENIVERQFALHASRNADQLHEEFLERMRLSNISPRDFDRMKEIVRRMAKRLAALHARRRRVAQRGQLDVRQTLRRNYAHDGLLFDLRWKYKKIKKPKVFAICDVSGSVAAVAQFLLMFLYGLHEVLPNVRAFAFSGNMKEVTDLFEQHEIEQAIKKAVERVGFGRTDYGRSLLDFSETGMDDLDNHSTVIILGDARSNFMDPRPDLMKAIFDRSRRVIWLNPEPRTFWNVGDAVMPRYLPYVHLARTCATLKDLERIVDGLLKAVTDSP
ncbi:MAG: VWA domain-containing protein [Alphaproteobacteria bacterium]